MHSFLVVLKKELKDIFRDKKTIIFTVLLPILIFPLMFKVMGYGMEKTQKSAIENINLALNGDTDSTLANLLKTQPNITIFNNDTDQVEALKNGKLQLIVNIPENFDKDLDANKQPNLEILYDETSNNSNMASSLVEKIVSGLKNNIIAEKLEAKGIDSKVYLEPFTSTVKSGVSDGAGNPLSSMILNMLPSFIIIFMLTPVLSIAADIGAGEKEKNTFEPLLSTSCNRNSLLWGKVISISLISAIALVLSLASMYYGMTNLYGSMSSGDVGLTLDIKSILIILGLSLILLLAICAIQISISIFARSTKEAGTYLSGVITPIMIISYIPMFMDAKNLSGFIFHLPIANSVALFKELMTGVINTPHILIVFVWHIFYLILAVLATKYLFSREEVVFRS